MTALRFIARIVLIALLAYGAHGMVERDISRPPQVAGISTETH